MWAFGESFVYYPYFVRLLYHKQLKNSDIILQWYLFLFKEKPYVDLWLQYATQTDCVIDKMAILSNTNVRCSICESERESIFIRICLSLSTQADACKSEGTPAGTKCRWPSGSADGICLLLLMYVVSTSMSMEEESRLNFIEDCFSNN